MFVYFTFDNNIIILVNIIIKSQYSSRSFLLVYIFRYLKKFLSMNIYFIFPFIFSKLKLNNKFNIFKKEKVTTKRTTVSNVCTIIPIR